MLEATGGETAFSANLSSYELKEKQFSDLTLSSLFDKTWDRSNKENCLEREILFREVKDNTGNQRSQIVVFTDLRAEILKLCHSGISCHHGNRRTKDKILKHYFWPNVIRDTKNYVRSCDACQRIENGGEVKKHL